MMGKVRSICSLPRIMIFKEKSAPPLYLMEPINLEFWMEEGYALIG
jgi:hypothetical protein